MAVDLINCDRPLTALIQTIADPPNLTWHDYFFDHLDDYTLKLSNKANVHNTSYAWEITDHVSRNKDVLTMNGTMSCIGCGRKNIGKFNGVEEELKYFKERMLFNRRTLARITLPDFIFIHAVLVNATIKTTHNEHQRKSISLTFEGYNFTGTVFKPDSQTGGVYSNRIRQLSSDTLEPIFV